MLSKAVYDMLKLAFLWTRKSIAKEFATASQSIYAHSYSAGYVKVGTL
jgi:hypothetical protein